MRLHFRREDLHPRYQQHRAQQHSEKPHRQAERATRFANRFIDEHADKHDPESVGAKSKRELDRRQPAFGH